MDYKSDSRLRAIMKDLKEKDYKSIEVAANHMALFAPFIPALTEMVK